MSRLLVMRHAKSAWPDVPDQERPLAGRGRRAAPRVGQWLRDSDTVPDTVICSTARRARETWQLVAGELGTTPVVSYDERAYGANGQELLELARQAPADARTLLLVAHDPGVVELTLMLAASPATEAGVQLLERVETKFPTGAVAVLSCAGPWAQLSASGSRLIEFVAPRGLPHQGKP